MTEEKTDNKQLRTSINLSQSSTEGNSLEETKQGRVSGVGTTLLSKIQSRASLLEKIWVGLAIALTVGLLCWFLASIWVLLLKSPPSSAAAVSPPKVEIIFSPIIQTMKNGPQGDVAFVYDTASMERQIQLWQPRINQAFGDAYESAMKDKTEAMQTRISDTWSAVQGIGLISAVIGILITVVVLYFSFANADQINSAKAEMFADAKVEVNNHLMQNNVLKDVLEEIIKNNPEIMKRAIDTNIVYINETIVRENGKNAKNELQVGDQAVPTNQSTAFRLPELSNGSLRG